MWLKIAVASSCAPEQAMHATLTWRVRDTLHRERLLQAAANGPVHIRVPLHQTSPCTIEQLVHAALTRQVFQFIWVRLHQLLQVGQRAKPLLILLWVAQGGCHIPQLPGLVTRLQVCRAGQRC